MNQHLQDGGHIKIQVSLGSHTVVAVGGHTKIITTVLSDGGSLG